MKLKPKPIETGITDPSHDGADHIMGSGPAEEALSSGPSSEEESDDDSDDSDAGGAADLAPEVAQQLMDLESQLENNPASMDTHLQYISLLQSARLRQRLHSAHECCSDRFPLSEPLWLAWIDDEIEAFEESGDVGAVEDVMRRGATRDYIAPAVWAKLQSFLLEFNSEVSSFSPAGIAKFRAVSEEALAAAGLHFTDGGAVWANLRKFERALLESKRGGAKQAEQVASLYARQLAVPLADAAATFEEYRAWEASRGQGMPTSVEEQYKCTAADVAVRAASEAAVGADRPADVAKLGAYLAYIRLETVTGEPSRVQVVFERALSSFPATASLWLQYGSYLEGTLKIPGLVSALWERAVRNCPWMGAMWVRAIRAMDRQGSDVGKIYRSAMAAGLQGPNDYLEVSLAYLDALRHRCASLPNVAAPKPSSKQQAPQALPPAPQATLRAAFKDVAASMERRFPGWRDSGCVLTAYSAHCEEVVMLDGAAARAVWETAVTGPGGRFADPWLGFAAFERARRCVREARSILKRCYGRAFEDSGSVLVCNEWLRFEREEGSAEELLHASAKVEPILEEAAAAADAAADASAAADAKLAARQAPQLTKEEMQRMRQEKDPNFGKKASVEAAAKSAEEPKPKSKKKKEKEAAVEAAGGSKRAHPPADASTEGEAGPSTSPKAKRAKKQPTAAADASQAPADEDMGDASAGAAAATPTAPTLQPAPKKAKPAKVKPAEATDADTDMDGSAAAGSAAAATAAAAATEAATSVEDHLSNTHIAPVRFTDECTAFVRNLRFELKDADLQAFFAGCGEVTGVRVVREPGTGKAKGFAYVQFGSREALESAIALDGADFQKRKLIIAESRPPPTSSGERGGRGGRGRGRHDNFGGGRGHQHEYDRGDHRQGSHSYAGQSDGHFAAAPGAGHRHQLDVADAGARPAAAVTAFLPRALAKAAEAPAEGGLKGAPASKLSNDDFRKMLFSKK